MTPGTILAYSVGAAVILLILLLVLGKNKGMTVTLYTRDLSVYSLIRTFCKQRLYQDFVYSTRFQHVHSKYALTLYTSAGTGADGKPWAALVFSEEDCYPGDFDRVPEVLRKFGITDFRIVRERPDGPRLLVVVCGRDRMYLHRIVQYIFMDALHLPREAKIHVPSNWAMEITDPAEVERVRRLIETAREASEGPAAA